MDRCMLVQFDHFSGAFAWFKDFTESICIDILQAMTFVVVKQYLSKLEREDKHTHSWFSSWYDVNG